VKIIKKPEHCFKKTHYQTEHKRRVHLHTCVGMEHWSQHVMF